MKSVEKAAILIEALPYLQKFREQTFVIKMGGSAMDDEVLVEKLMRDVVFLEVAGINPVIVHGGGKAISAAMQKAGLEAKFVGGFRVTTDDAIDIVEQTLSHDLNPKLVSMINKHGGDSIGMSGSSVFCANRIQGRDAEGLTVDIGRVGEVSSCNIDKIQEAIAQTKVPVVSPLGLEEESGLALNINADLAAAALACALKPAKLVYISDVPGLLLDKDDPSTLINSVNQIQAKSLINDGTISGGMIPKISSALDSLNSGVKKVHFIDGRQPHTLLLEIFTQSGIGTEIIAS